MTSLQLVVWIAGGVLLQVAIYLGIGVLRHWQDYLALRTSVVEGDVVEDGAGIVRTAVHPAAPVAWPGWRDFQVVDKRFEDASQQVLRVGRVPHPDAVLVSCVTTGLSKLIESRALSGRSSLQRA